MPRKKKKSKAWLLGLAALAFFGLSGTAAADDDDDDDDDDDGPKVRTGKPTTTGPTDGPRTGRPGGPTRVPTTEPTRVPTTEPTKVPDEPFTGPAEPIRVPGVGTTDPLPSQVDDIVKTYPGPNSFYEVKWGDNFTGESGGIATRYGLSCLFLAATIHGGMSDAEAVAWAKARNKHNGMRVPATLLITCAPINDARFGTYAFNPSKTIAGGNGRGIRLLKINGPDINRIRAGLPMIRNVRIGAPGDSPSVSGSPVEGMYREYEALWLPGCNLEVLWLSDGTIWEPGGTWADGSSQINPPPAIYALGIIDYSDAGVEIWGCAPNTAAVPEIEA